MGTVCGYVCDRCPLAFEVGDYTYWDLTGDSTKVVCGACGTMHRVEQKGQASRILALPGPVRKLPFVTRPSGWGDGSEVADHEWPFTERDWEEVARHPVPVPLGQIGCARCQSVGRLLSLDDIVSRGEDQCPVCPGRLRCVYMDTIN